MWCVPYADRVTKSHGIDWKEGGKEERKRRTGRKGSHIKSSGNYFTLPNTVLLAAETDSLM